MKLAKLLNKLYDTQSCLALSTTRVHMHINTEQELKYTQDDVDDAIRMLNPSVVAELNLQTAEAYDAYHTDKTKSRVEAGLLCEQAGLAWIQAITLGLPVGSRAKAILEIEKALFVYVIGASHFYQHILDHESDFANYRMAIILQNRISLISGAFGKKGTYDDAIDRMQKLSDTLAKNFGAAEAADVLLNIAENNKHYMAYELAIKQLCSSKFDARNVNVTTAEKFYVILKELFLANHLDDVIANNLEQLESRRFELHRQGYTIIDPPAYAGYEKKIESSTLRNRARYI